MSYRNLRFLEYVMTSISAGLPVTANLRVCLYSKPKRGKLAHIRKRRPQDVTDNIYLNDNKCTML